MKVIGIGDNVCDQYAHLGMMFPGGQALNFSVYAKMLGADASYMGVFGSDAVAEHVIRTLEELGIEHGRCRRYPGENGCARVTLENGERVFLGSNRGGVAREHPLELTDEDLEYIRSFSLVHTSNNSYFERQLPRVSATGIPISYDFSVRWVDESLVKQVAPYASWVFLSCGARPEEEVREICRDLNRAGCRRIVATRGSLGSACYDGEELIVQPPKLVEAVDTLGAGDSFATAFLLSLLEDEEEEPERTAGGRSAYRARIRRAMEKGAEFAAKTCLVQGAFGHGTALPA